MPNSGWSNDPFHVAYMKEAGPSSPERPRLKAAKTVQDDFSKVTLQADAPVLNSTLVTWHGPKMVQCFTSRP